MKKISRNVFVLGLVSFLTDLSSEMVIPVILPLYMKSLGVTLPMIGLIEGIAESASLHTATEFLYYLDYRLPFDRLRAGTGMTLNAKPNFG